MRITKYPQSCLVIEKNGQSIVIDPGTLVTAKYKLTDLGLVEAVLYTHEHSDHFDPQVLESLRKDDVEIYCNQDVASKIEGSVKVVHDKDEFVVAGFSITALELPHFPLGDGIEPPLNTGFLIDGSFFHSGDGYELDGVKSDHAALPIGGRPEKEFMEIILKFADSLKALKIIPMHFDGRYKPDPKEFVDLAGEARVILLNDGESVEF